MDRNSVLLILAAVALFATWRWVKHRERQELEDFYLDQAPAETAPNPIGFHAPAVNG